MTRPVTRVDLDTIETMASTYAPDGWVRQVVPPMAAELRAARNVVEAARKADHAVDLIGTTEYSRQCLAELSDAVHTYDDLVRS